jgi:hypothetical protein
MLALGGGMRGDGEDTSDLSGTVVRIVARGHRWAGCGPCCVLVGQADRARPVAGGLGGVLVEEEDAVVGVAAAGARLER